MTAATGAHHVVLATAGHVDHGKTALIRALTGTDTDRLPEEKRRGISIELGFAELASRSISFIDVPGHRKLVHTMIAGVGGVDGVLLVVAADDGVMPQTREHLHVCSLLGVERVVVALTKCDLVDAETRALAEADVRTTLAALSLEPQALVACSAVTGAGIEAVAEALSRLAESVPARAASARAWLAIDRVFSVKGAGTVVTGTLTRGRLTAGAPAWIVGPEGARETSCRALQIHGRSVEQAEAPTRVAVNLTRLGLDELTRGEVLTLDADLSRSRRIDVALRALPGTERALGRRSPVVVHAGTTRVAGRVSFDAPGLAQITLDGELPCEGGLGVVLRGFSATSEHGAVLAGGRILDAAPAPAPRKGDAARRELRVEALSAIGDRDFVRGIRALLAGSAPRPLVSADIERRLGLEPGSVPAVLGGFAIELDAGRSWVSPSGIDALMLELVALIAKHHESHPHEPGASLETARATLAKRSSREAAAHALAEAARLGRVRLLDQGLVCLPSFAAASREGVEAAGRRLLDVLEACGLLGASESELQARTGDAPAQIRATLARLASSEHARRLGGLWFLEARLDRLRVEVRTHLSSHGSISVPTFKDLAGVSRKQAIPLLEQLDREGTTQRRGDLRVLGTRTQ